jgi:hypothetical protein
VERADPALGGADVTAAAVPGVLAAAPPALPLAPPGTSGLAAAAALLALAVLVGAARPGPGRLHALVGPAAPPAADPPALRRPWIVLGAVAVAALGWAVAGPLVGAVLGGLAGAAGLAAAHRSGGRGDTADAPAADLAAAWELVAVGLRAGLPVAVAVSAAAGPLGGAAGAALRRVGGLLELGADAAHAWRTVERDPALCAFARAAGRSAATGAALAEVARAEADRLRSALVDSAQERAQRAAVLITGPLGLCFLPAFLALGIAPVVVGLAGEALAQW